MEQCGRMCQNVRNNGYRKVLLDFDPPCNDKGSVLLHYTKQTNAIKSYLVDGSST